MPAVGAERRCRTAEPAISAEAPHAALVLTTARMIVPVSPGSSSPRKENSPKPSPARVMRTNLAG